MHPRVTSVEPTNDYRLRLTFTNAEIGVFDCSHLLTFGVFREFNDIDYFRRAYVSHGTVVWPNHQDICPDTLYEDSIKLTSLAAEQPQALEPAIGSIPNRQSSPPAQ